MTQREWFCRQLIGHPSMEARDLMKLCFQAAFGAEHLVADPGAAEGYLREEFENVSVTEEALWEEISEETVRVNLGAWKREGLPEKWLLRMFLQTAAHSPRDGGRRFRELTELVTDILEEEAAAEIEGASRPGQAEAVPEADGLKERQAFSQQVAAEQLKEGQAFSQWAAAEQLKEGQEFSQQIAAEQLKDGAPGESCRQDSASRLRQWREYLAAYPMENPHAVHHSERYRAVEKPAYRLVCRRFLRIFPVLTKLAALYAQKGEGSVLVVALDGRSASGKTTLAEQLRAVTGAGVVHMDDFFLPGELRTAERLEEPGGNVHYERFALEVLPLLRGSETFSYRAYDCGRMTLVEERSVPGGNLRIVEGAYSCHPVFGEYMDLRAFCDVESGEQEKRILARNGEEMLRQFRERWIPMEEKYFETFRIREKAELLL